MNFRSTRGLDKTQEEGLLSEREIRINDSLDELQAKFDHQLYQSRIYQNQISKMTNQNVN